MNPVSLLEGAATRLSGEILVHLCLPRDLDITIGQLRANFLSSTIIAIRDIESPSVRINALLAGADSCYGASISYSEVAAAIQSAQRKLTLSYAPAGHAARRSEPAPGQVATSPPPVEKAWRLGDNEWTLIPPGGEGISLTRMERLVLQAIHRHPEKLVGRGDFTDESADIASNGRSLDLIVSRLKRKGNVAGASIPIRSMRGKGYAFSGELRVDGGREDAPASASIMPLLRMPGESRYPLLAAAQDDRLQFHYQPIVTAQTQEIAGAEALLRWKGAGGAGADIESLLRDACASEAADSLVGWGLRAISADQARWRQAAAGQGTVVNINVSPQSFARRDVVDAILLGVFSHGLTPRDLRLEISEAATSHAGPADVRAVLEEFTSLGVQVWLDDFGKGYNNLAWLSTLPLAGLKLEKSIVWNAARNPDSHKVLRSICQLAKDLGITTVADGIETAAHRQAAQDAGCELMQGFLFYPPATGDEFARALAGQRAHRAAVMPGSGR
ncbi:EAL domain-containing protein [Achromobacter sp. UMC46]|uniref:EAL domain-containing protein n=1 Tax=Achromobacter sp. UMC46 TaxID=1862319 RepID=UPI002103E06E|nr:EAL domain-containing protein [Achromobacter sp. UMC46]